MNKDRGQIKYISGLKASKAVLTNYAKGRYSDETLIKHLSKYNEDRKGLMNIRDDKTFRDFLEARITYYRDADLNNKEILDAILLEHRSVTKWNDENMSYFASLEQTYDQVPDSVKRKIKKKFGDIDWDSATYDSNTGETLIVGAEGTLVLTIADHKAGEYDEETLKWSVRK